MFHEAVYIIIVVLIKRKYLTLLYFCIQSFVLSQLMLLHVIGVEL